MQLACDNMWCRQCWRGRRKWDVLVPVCQ